jgi:hypothetical protein
MIHFYSEGSGIWDAAVQSVQLNFTAMLADRGHNVESQSQGAATILE